jgi:hypothetical protein
LAVKDPIHVVIRANSDVAPVDIGVRSLVFDLHVENCIHQVLRALNDNGKARGLTGILNDSGKTGARGARYPNSLPGRGRIDDCASIDPKT